MSNPYRLSLSRYSTHGVIVANLGRNETVLDVGCNDGYIGSSADPSNRFYGLDVSAESVERARAVYRDAVVYDLNALEPLPWEETFDTIVCADVLEHVVRPDLALEFLLGHLRPGGRAIISLPNIANWAVRLKLLAGRFDYTESGILDRTHLHFYTYRTARQFVRSAGLEILTEEAGATLLGPIVGAVNATRPLLASGIILVTRKPE